jgi:molybdopterin-binding protein
VQRLVSVARASYSVSEAAQMLGVSIDTLRRWDRLGRIKTDRDGSNRRRVPASEIDRLGGNPDAGSMSARNRFCGVITDIAFDGLMGQVELVTTDPLRVVAIITSDAAEALGLAAGMSATAIIKSTSVTVMIDQ